MVPLNNLLAHTAFPFTAFKREKSGTKKKKKKEKQQQTLNIKNLNILTSRLGAFMYGKNKLKLN